MNGGILILEWNLPAALFETGKSRVCLRLHDRFVTPVVPAERKVARRLGSRIKMLMKPLIWRDNDTARFPGESFRLLAFRPHQRIAFAAQNDDMSARPVTV